ncbi:MAG: hypothetical protein RI883_479 [Bacteroidota bacterium]|jgi:bacillithiol system protein YtxJ
MGIFSSRQKKEIPWIQITSEAQLETAFGGSENKPALFFKHSTRCSISSMALSRFEQNAERLDEICDLYFIDLLAYRQVSNKLEEISKVIHQSPQVIVVKNKEIVYSATHSSIDAKEIERQLS